MQDRKAQAPAAHRQSIPEALREAFGRGGYVRIGLFNIFGSFA